MNEKRPISFEDQEKDMICDLCPLKIIKAKVFVDQDRPKYPVQIKCPGKCILQEWIGKLNIQIEPMIREIKDTNSIQSENYNENLSDLISNQQAKIDRALQISNKKKRAIAILFVAGMTQVEVSDLFSMSYRQINRIVNQNK